MFKKIISSILEGISSRKLFDQKGYVEFYLSQSVDHADLENRMRFLKSKNYL
jgi:hypothetical protein